MAIENYDPNNRFGKHRVRVTFRTWKHTHEEITVVGGNCKGLTVIESAINDLSEKAATKGMKFGTCSVEPGENEEYFKNMVVAAEILDFTPEKKSS